MKPINKKNLLIAALALVAVVEAVFLCFPALRSDCQADPSPEIFLDTEPSQEIPEETEVVQIPDPSSLSAPEILSASPVISHAMGAVDGVTTLNCLEGFKEQYAQGVRVFEVDLRLTSDMQVVLRHDWRAGWQDGISETSVPTLEEFLSAPLLERYTPLSFRDLLLLMAEYPDVCIITDTKFTDAEIVTLQFEAMLRDAQELGLTSLFQRMVVQVYSPLMFKVVNSLYQFPYYIYTLYSIGFGCTEEAFEEIAVFCRDSGISGVTMWSTWWNAAYAPIAEEYGLSVYTHTVNDPALAAAQLSDGINAVYTDYLTPSDLA